MGRCGVPIEKHHHEVAQAQGELGFRALSIVECADALQTYKYCIKNVAKKHNRTVTFMPKPIVGDNGSGMHVHSSLWKEGKPLFYDENGPYVKLSQMCMWYIGGILKHAPALLAITSPTVNSYKRLVPGYEAPVNLAYSQGNRSASIRIPMYQTNKPKAKRIEFRCPDPACNPYLCFSAILMAGLDGIQNKTDPGKPLDVDIYELGPEEAAKIPKTPGSLTEAINALEADHAWLTKGGVFTEDFIRAYITARRAEIKRTEVTPSPLEYEMYYHC
jgi:glutamine synthetase